MDLNIKRDVIGIYIPLSVGIEGYVYPVSGIMWRPEILEIPTGWLLVITQYTKNHEFKSLEDYNKNRIKNQDWYWINLNISMRIIDQSQYHN